METLSVKALVVREADVGDYDKLLTLITDEAGRLTVSAKGVKSIKSRHMPTTQLFCYGSFLLKKSRKYFYIAESELLESFYSIRCDLDKLSLATYICDVAADLALEGEADPALLRLTLNTLYALSNKTFPPMQIKAAFELRCADGAGFRPELNHCGVCGTNEGKMWLDVMNGRLLCDGCKATEQRRSEAFDEGTARIYFALSDAVLSAMRYTLGAPASKFLSFSLTESELAKYADICEKYLLNHIEHGFYSLKFYKSILL